MQAMMPGLEISISTLFLVIIAASATLAGAMAAVAWRNSRELLIWSWALGSNALAHVLYALRGQISDFASIVVANMAAAFTFSLFRAGIAYSQGSTLSWQRLYGPLSLMAVICMALLDNLPARSIIGCSIFALQSADCLLALGRRRRQTRGMGQYILMTGFLLTTAAFLVRVAALLSGVVQVTSIFTASWLQAATFFAILIALMLLATGLTLMVQERAVHELTESRGLLKERNAMLQQCKRPANPILKAARP